ncbi:lytic transglycosylase domain-containing protein [Lysinibacillus yapensis]|uniref:Lytic transglycosylase domain-containing protein n=2 Tax=Ureibacillus yapensis TaxID=2304605 RepID=A0A396SGL5_9BACL|nr:lytic transglycosylase domain-containing protein [Lysinibacillus yapensis]
MELQAIGTIGNSTSGTQPLTGGDSIFTQILEEMTSSTTSSLTEAENLLGFYSNFSDTDLANRDLYYNPQLGNVSGYNALLQNDQQNAVQPLNKDYLNTAGFENVLEGANAYHEIIQQASSKFGVPEKLIAAVIKQESNYNAGAVSSAGATGLMQLMPGTARYLGVMDSTDPAQNIMGGTKYLSQMLEKFDQNIELALAAYNAGPGNVSKYGGIPPFRETKNYVQKVMNYYQA